FADCYFLYQNVVGMCRLSKPASFRAPPPAQASAPPAQPARPPADASAHSAAPPAQPSGLPPLCQSLVSNYVAAAQANDGPKALAGYNALKQAGGCGVLAKVDRPLAATAGPAVDDPRFQSRGARPLSDQVLGACDDSPEA